MHHIHINCILLYTSALPAAVLSFCEKSSSLLCHLIELLRLLLFYLSVCWSLCKVGGRPSLFSLYKRSVSCEWSCVDQMCAIDWQLIFIKAALGKGGWNIGCPEASFLSEDSPLLIRLTESLCGDMALQSAQSPCSFISLYNLCCIKINTFPWSLRSRVCLLYQKLQFTCREREGKTKNRQQHSAVTFFISRAASSDDLHTPALFLSVRFLPSFVSSSPLPVF